MEFPKYPRHLEPAERRAVVEESMERELAAFALEIAEGGGKLTESVREEFRLQYAHTCLDSWQDERIVELEKRLEAMGRKIALLNERLKEVSDVD